MLFSNDNLTYTEWQPYSKSKSWNLIEGDGLKIVYVRFKDGAGLVSTYSDTIVLDATPPITIDDYNGEWHNVDFMITLEANDNLSGVAETCYRINNGPVKIVSINGQPRITIGSANNTVEYWSVDYAGNEELPHRIITGIRLDKTPPFVLALKRLPEGAIEPGEEVKVIANITDSLSGVKDVVLSYSINNSPIWTNVTMTFNTTLGLYKGLIEGQKANTLVGYKIMVYDNSRNCKVEDNNGQYYVYTVIPEFSSTMLILLLILTTLITTVLQKKGKTNLPNFSVMKWLLINATIKLFPSAWKNKNKKEKVFVQGNKNKGNV